MQKRRNVKFAYAIRKYAGMGEATKRVMDRMAKAMKAQGYDVASGALMPEDEKYWDAVHKVINDEHRKNWLKGYGIPTAGGIGGGALGAGGGYLLAKAFGGKNPAAWSLAGGLLGTGAGLAASIPLTNNYRDDYRVSKLLKDVNDGRAVAHSD